MTHRNNLVSHLNSQLQTENSLRRTLHYTWFPILTVRAYTLFLSRLPARPSKLSFPFSLSLAFFCTSTPTQDKKQRRARAFAFVFGLTPTFYFPPASQSRKFIPARTSKITHARRARVIIICYWITRGRTAGSSDIYFARDFARGGFLLKLVMGSSDFMHNYRTGERFRIRAAPWSLYVIYVRAAGFCLTYK